MIVAMMDKRIDFLDIEEEDIALYHANVILEADIDNLPKPYLKIGYDPETETYQISVN